MATTGVDFLLQSKAATNISGTAVRSSPYVQAIERNASLALAGRVPGGVGTGLLGAAGRANNGNFLMDGFAQESFALNGAFHVTTTGTTAVNIDLTNLATGATSTAGDVTFAKWNKLRFYNVGAAAMTISPGATNGLAFLGGTTPTLTVPPGSMVTLENAAGFTIDATHKVITVTPTAGGDFLLGVGGA